MNNDQTKLEAQSQVNGVTFNILIGYPSGAGKPPKNMRTGIAMATIMALAMLTVAVLIYAPDQFKQLINFLLSLVKAL